MLDKCQPSFNFYDNVILGLTEVAEKEGIEKAITIERRNSIIKTILPDIEDFNDLFTMNADALKFYISEVKIWAAKVDGEEIELEDEDIISIAMSNIGKEMWKYRAKKIYD